MRVSVLLSGLLVGLMACTSGLENLPTKTSKSDLVFDSLAQTGTKEFLWEMQLSVLWFGRKEMRSVFLWIG